MCSISAILMTRASLPEFIKYKVSIGIALGTDILTTTSKQIVRSQLKSRKRLRVYAWGMGDNSIFIVFSNIWSSVRLKIPPQFQASWQHRLFTLDMGSLTKNDSFSFYNFAPCLYISYCC
jgi:hypothetical protein